jgi:MFS family permease
MCWWSGAAFSLVGSYVSAMAFPLLVVFTTGSILDAGVIAAAGRIGILATSLWGGALADRVSRRLILVAIPLAQALLMGVVAWSVHAGQVLIPFLAAASLLDGALVGINQGAILPALRRIVPREQFAARAAQEQGLHQAAQLIGSPLAAFLFTASRWLPFAGDALSFTFAASGAALIRRPLGPDRPDGAQNVPSTMLTDIVEGLRFVRRHGFLRYMTAWIAVANMVGNSFLLMLIALLKNQDAGPRTIGIINSAVVAGGILGSILAGWIITRLGSRRVFVLGGWTYVASLALAAVAPQPWEIALAGCLFVFASVPVVSVWEAYTAIVVPDQLIGRVGAVSNFAAQSLVWIGMLLMGFLSDHFGAPAAVLIFAALLLPFAVADHLATALTVLKTPLQHVEELR